MSTKERIELEFLEKKEQILAARYERMKEHISGFNTNEREDAYLAWLKAKRNLDIFRLERGNAEGAG